MDLSIPNGAILLLEPGSAAFVDKTQIANLLSSARSPSGVANRYNTIQRSSPEPLMLADDPDETRSIRSNRGMRSLTIKPKTTRNKITQPFVRQNSQKSIASNRPSSRKMDDIRTQLNEFPNMTNEDINKLCNSAASSKRYQPALSSTLDTPMASSMGK